MTTPDLTLSELRSLLHYDPETGVFTWLKSRGRVRRGQRAGRLSHGYVRVKVNGSEYAAHRLAWFCVHGHWPRQEIDHINNDPLDNRLCNLRDISASMNQQNQRRAHRRNNTSGIVGVSWHKKSQKWRAYVTVMHKQHHLGFFNDKEDARRAMVAGVKALYPGYAP